VPTGNTIFRSGGSDIYLQLFITGTSRSPGAPFAEARKL